MEYARFTYSGLLQSAQQFVRDFYKTLDAKDVLISMRVHRPDGSGFVEAAGPDALKALQTLQSNVDAELSWWELAAQAFLSSQTVELVAKEDAKVVPKSELPNGELPTGGDLSV